MNLIVIGCGRIGAELSWSLYQKGHQVTVVDEQASSFSVLDPDFRGRIIEGDPLLQDVLHRAGIENADALAAVSNQDTVNAVVGHIAREVYHVPTVIVRSYDSRYRPLIEAFGLQVVSPSSWGAQRIEELLCHRTLRSVFTAGNGEIDVYELVLPETWEGKTVQDLIAGHECRVVAITRAGRAFLPSADSTLLAADVIHISATLEGIAGVRALLDIPKEL